MEKLTQAPIAFFVSDPIGNFHPEAETTSFLMAEAAARGLAVWQATPEDLYFDSKTVKAKARELAIAREEGRFRFSVIREVELALDAVQWVFLRKDPPVDMAYIAQLQLLSLLERERGPVLVNRPSGILCANEKLAALRFPGIFPETAVTADRQVFLNFLAAHREIILKPLYRSGGEGVHRVRSGDAAAASIFASETEALRVPVMLQRYLPEAESGDKRILLWDGEILGAFLRVPKPGDFRGNMHQGARWEKAVLGPRDRDIVHTLAPWLREQGLIFVGLDVIGEYVTEVNVTSPMGIREINGLYGLSVEKHCLDRLLTH